MLRPRSSNQLEELESTRRGEVYVQGVSDELGLRFLATDRAGHMAIGGQLRRRLDVEDDVRLEFTALRFEPTQPPGLLLELRAGAVGT